MKWLVTAFEPFAGARTNSSQIVLKHLKDLPEFKDSVSFLEAVPVTFAEAWPYIETRAQGVRGVLALGQAEGRAKISLERLGLNWMDSKTADNTGQVHAHRRIQEGPDLLWSPLPWEKLSDQAEWQRSYSAGTFVCNTLLYQGLRWAQTSGALVGFVHVPALVSQSELSHHVRMDDDIAKAAMAEILRFVVRL